MADVDINKFRAQVIRDGFRPSNPGFVESEGQNPVDPAGSGQNHLPVTIAAAATGLSITESQVLGGAGTTLQYLRGDASLATFPDLTGFVPYTGANQTVNLNTQQLQAGHTTLTTNGSTETLTINHTSGSGKAINVTKGGNGEGLYINKTSGSGNAATIVGTLEATTLVKTGGTSSQFLKADGSIDSTSYQPLLTNPVTGTGTTNVLPKFTGSTTIGDSVITDNTNEVTINKRVFVNNSVHSISFQPNNSGVSNRIESTNLPLEIITAGASLILAAGGVSPQISLASTGVVTLSNLAGSGTRMVVANASGVLSTQSIAANQVTGTGTTNYLPKFTGSTTIGNSQVFDNGTNVGIGTTSPGRQLEVYSATSDTRIAITNTTSTSGAAKGFELLLAGSDAYAFNYVNGAMIFGTNSAERMRITSSGNVGIGTTSPANALHVYNSSQGVARFESTQGEVNIALNNSSASGNLIGTIGAAFYFYSGGSERIRLTSSGNLLVGTTTDNGARLQVSGTATFSGNVVLGTTALSGGGAAQWLTANGNPYGGGLISSVSGVAKAYYYYDNAANAALVQAAAGVGVQLWANNTVALSIASTGAATFSSSVTATQFNSTSSSASLPGFGVSSGNGMYNAGANVLAFSTASSERMRITSGGYLKASNDGVYLGAGNSYHELNSNFNAFRVVNIKNSNNTSGNGVISSHLGSNCNNTSSYHFVGYTGTDDKMFIYGNGNVVNVNNSYGSLSDIKLKENIEDATLKLDELMKVKVRNYNLIGDDKKQIGVIAQELEEVFPAMIDESEDFEEVEVPQLNEEGNEVLNEKGEVLTEKQRVSKGTSTKSVKYSVFVPMLIKAIQELKQEIDTLKN